MSSDALSPSYDPAVLRSKRRSELDALAEAFKALLGFGTALVLPNREAGFTQCRVTHVKKTKLIKP